MKYSADDREQLLDFIRENQEKHVIFLPDRYKPDGNVQINVDHLTFLLHRWLYEQLIGPPPPYLLPNCDEGKMCQNPYHRKGSKGPTEAQYLSRPSRATGQGLSAPEINKAKTHCPQNHEYTPDNTYIWVDAGGHRHRKCRTCTAKRTRAQHRAEQQARQERK